MALVELVPVQPPVPAAWDIQQTTFSHDVLGRYACNTWAEIQQQQSAGGYPFDVIVIGAGMFGGYCAEKLYRQGVQQDTRVLLIDAGAFLLPSHIQNLPQRLGGVIGGPDITSKSDAGFRNVVWRVPWISNEPFPGLAYCVGGRSLFWGGWSPRLTANDLANWPPELRQYLTAGPTPAYQTSEEEIGVTPSTDYIVHASLYSALKTALDAAKPTVPTITEVGEAPLAVQGAAPASGIFPFDKFSSAPFLLDAIRHDAANNTAQGDLSRRIFLLPNARVLRLNRNGSRVVSLDVYVDGQQRLLPLTPGASVVLANGTIEATRLALDGLGVGNTQSGSPRVGNLMAHLRSNITVRIKRSVLGLSGPPTDIETVAFLVRGEALGRRFHQQLIAASVFGANPESVMWSMVPDIEFFQNMLSNQNTDWVTLVLRGIGEMEDQRSLTPDPAKSWIDLSSETDDRGVRRAYVNLVPTAKDRALWTAMDSAAFDLAQKLAKSPGNIEYLGPNGWQPTRPQPDANGRGFWQDAVGSTHHEAGTLFSGAPGSSITDTLGKFHGIDNAYVAGPAVFPTLGSANPSLTALSLTRRTARAILQAGSGAGVEPGFTALSLAPSEWTFVKMDPALAGGVRNFGTVLETFGSYGLYWYTKEQFANFILKLDWRVARRDDNSGVFIRTPGPAVADPLNAAVAQGHEVQIDERGFDSVSGTEGHPQKRTGAIYDLQAPSSFPSRPIGEWNTYLIEANGSQIRVTLNGQSVNVYKSTRQSSGFIALQAYKPSSRVQFRNLQVKKLPPT
jgi:choline dehydrogenase-like flavoprotein